MPEVTLEPKKHYCWTRSYTHFGGQKEHLEDNLPIRFGNNVHSHVMFILYLDKMRFTRYSFTFFVNLCWISCILLHCFLDGINLDVIVEWLLDVIPLMF